ncbi:MAG: hypothetical protein QOI93_5101 [Rhodospirillaceae bacterium]|nr:hypothetical protein [Rhodospirillaceae bacterium]
MVQFNFLEQSAAGGRADVCFGAHYGLKSEVALSPKSAKDGSLISKLQVVGH